MSELKVTSKKYNDRDVLEVDNLGEAVNEEIEAGKIAGGTKLYKHNIQFDTEDYIELINNTKEPIINGTLNANNVATLQTYIYSAVSIYYNFSESGSLGGGGRPITISIDFMIDISKAKISVPTWNNNPNNPQTAIDIEEVEEAFDTVTEL